MAKKKDDDKVWTVGDVKRALDGVPDEATVGVRSGTDTAETEGIIGVRREKPLGDDKVAGQVVFEH